MSQDSKVSTLHSSCTIRQAQQKQHESYAKKYDANPQMYPSKYPTAAQHCREWAYNDGQSAKKAFALAEMHPAMARDAAK
jgi:hypothetical protein